MKNGKIVGQNGELSGKTILLVNTGSIKKKFVVQRIKKLGLHLIVLNKEIVSWAQPYVDQWILADTGNHQEALQAVKVFLQDKQKVNVDGVMTFWEDDVLLTARICDRFNFIGIPFDVAKKARNKHLFREFCVSHGLPAPRYKLVKAPEDMEYVQNNFVFPLVIKPTYGSSSAYVVKAENFEELQEIYNYVKKNISTTGESALADGMDIMVEEYIDGNEVDIDMLLQNGKLKFFSIVDNFKTEEPFFIETQEAVPSSLPDKDQDKLVEMAEKILEKLGVQNGCVHFEAKITKTGPMPLEVNLRLGGDEAFAFSKEAWHVDLIDGALKIAIGIYLDKVIKPEEPYKYLISQTLTPPHSGLLVKLDLDEKLKTNKNIVDLFIFKEVGDSVLVPPEGYEYMGWVTVQGYNDLDAEENLEEVLKDIKFEVAKYDPASSIGKTSRKNRFSMAAINTNILKGAAKIENIRRLVLKDKRDFRIGIIGNNFAGIEGTVQNEPASVGNQMMEVLAERGYQVTLFDFNNVAKAYQELKESNIDLAFNVCERINGPSLLEPHVAALLDTLQIPYTGSNPLTLGICIDKIKVKKLLTYHNIPTPKWDYVYSLDEEIRADLEYPLIVKPSNTDNSTGISNDSVVTNPAELKRQLKQVIVELKRPALIEEYIEGDEYDVAILGSEEKDLRVLPLSRSIFDKLPAGYWHIYPFEAKFLNDPIYKNNIELQEPAKNINVKLSYLISEIALDTYSILDCHDYGRVEIKVDKNNNPYVLELNPNPSLSPKAMLPAAAKLVGEDYGDLLEQLIVLAVKRYQKKSFDYNLYNFSL